MRIVSATHKNLAQEVQNGTFRQDLFFRLNVIDLVIAPLRERAQDLPDLCQALLTRIAQESDVPTPTLRDDVLQELAAMPLSGNVRELENLLYRAVALGDGLSLKLDQPMYTAPAVNDSTLDAPQFDVDPTIEPDQTTPETATCDLQARLDQLERALLVQALQATQFNRTAAAARLGLNLRQMRYRMGRLKIDAPHADETLDASD